MTNDFILDETLLEKLNKFTRTDVTNEEVYTFPVVLCDNEIDRDNERFSIPALQKLAELFVGKTGIFDHNPRGENQTARIFDCEVKDDISHTTSAGEPYTCLVGKAYIIRTKKTEDLIAEIDGGIKKEVSVGCTVAKQICSVCGSDQRENPCAHIKGKSYGGNACAVILDEPTDAYEWSFVAVPAQKNAGVSKTFSDNQSESEVIKSLKNRLSHEEEISARACEILKREIISLSFMCKPIMATQTVKMLCDKMSFSQLETLYNDLKAQCAKSSDDDFQLVKKQGNVDTKNNNNTNFKLK